MEKSWIVEKGVFTAKQVGERPAILMEGASCIIKNVDVENTSEYNKTTDLAG